MLEDTQRLNALEELDEDDSDGESEVSNGTAIMSNSNVVWMVPISHLFLLSLSIQDDDDEGGDASGEEEESDADTCEADEDEDDEYLDNVKSLSKLFLTLKILNQLNYYFCTS